MKILVFGAVGLFLLAVIAMRGSGRGDVEDRVVRDSSQGAETERGSEYSKSGYDVTQISKERVDQLAKTLSPDERHVILEEGTERAFTGDLLENKKDGLYACRLCGLPLFSSETKFKSGTGWPSFYKPYDPSHVHEETDRTLGMARTEIECARCAAHLGHVFNDGPQPTGLRYCTNSASLRFLEAGADLPAESSPANIETGYFAGGCFWGIEDRFQQVPGVIDAVSGYQGGQAADPSYEQVCRGDTGHAETVRVRFDAGRVTYHELLDWFFKFHDPTQIDRQGPDVGTQYRSAVFASTDEQLSEARATIAELERAGRFGGRKLATVVKEAGPFFKAEEYHQDYHAKHGGSCALPTIESPD